MSGGTIAKKGFRYQDLCAVYFALNEFKEEATFDRLYCEQDKHDFEIWNTDSFTGFQVKTNATGLTAKEVNTILLYYLSKAVSSGKRDKKFWFVFGKQPVKSLGHLFAATRNGTRGISYSGHTKRYIETALENISINAFPVDFHLLDEVKVQQLAFSISKEILEKKLGPEAKGSLKMKTVEDFVARFRDEVDRISCKDKEDERVYTTREIGSFIDEFVAGLQSERYEDQGANRDAHRIEIKLPETDVAHILETRVITKIRPLSTSEESGEGEPIKE